MMFSILLVLTLTGAHSALAASDTIVATLSTGTYTYFISYLFAWQYAKNACEDFSMTLLQTETLAECTAVSNWMKTIKPNEEFHIWTAGVEIGSTHEYKWAISGEKFGSNINWLNGLPVAENEHCVEFIRKVDSTGFFFNSAACTAEREIICEAKPTTTTTTTTTLAPVTEPAIVVTSTPAPVTVQTVINEGSTIPPVTGPIKIKLATGTYQYFDDEIIWDDATAACKALGMVLVSTETPEEFTAVTDWLKTIMPSGNFRIWSSGVEIGTSRTFKWSSSGVMFGSDITWFNGGPENVNNHCVDLIRINSEVFYLSDMNCLAQMPYICEKIVLCP